MKDVKDKLLKVIIILFLSFIFTYSIIDHYNYSDIPIDYKTLNESHKSTRDKLWTELKVIDEKRIEFAKLHGNNGVFKKGGRGVGRHSEFYKIYDVNGRYKYTYIVPKDINLFARKNLLDKIESYVFTKEKSEIKIIEREVKRKKDYRKAFALFIMLVLPILFLAYFIFKGITNSSVGINQYSKNKMFRRKF